MATTVLNEKITGLVIRQDLYKEDALKITLLTSDSLVSLIVRGARKMESKLKHLTPLITQIECMASTNRTINTLTEGVVVNNYTFIKEHPLHSAISLAIFELISAFCETITDYHALYLFTIKMLDLLNTTNYPMSIFCLYNIKMWYLLGSQPDFKACPVCGKDGLHFDVAGGGLLCKEHRHASSLDTELSKLIRLIYLVKINKIDEELLKIINDYQDDIVPVIKDYYQTYFDYTNRNLKIIEMMLI